MVKVNNNLVVGGGIMGENIKDLTSFVKNRMEIGNTALVALRPRSAVLPSHATWGTNSTAQAVRSVAKSGLIRVEPCGRYRATRIKRLR